MWRRRIFSPRAPRPASPAKLSTRRARRAALSGDAAPSIARTVAVPGIRPRDRADRGLADLRAELLEGLGVDTHHRITEETR